MKAVGHLGSLVRTSAVYAVGNALNRLGGFLLLPLYTSRLSVAEYGTLEFLYAISSIVGGVLSMGIASATLRFYFDYEEEADRRAVISTNFWASLLMSIAGVGVAGAALYRLHDTLLPAQTPVIGVWLVLAAICLELSTEVCLAYLRAKEMPVFFVSISLAKLVVQCAANIYFVRVANAGIVGVLSGNLLAIAAEWLVLAGFCLHACGVRFEWRKLMPVLRYCAPFLLTTLVGIVSGNFDRFVVNTLLSVQALGVYALALKFMRVMSDFIGIPFGLAYGSYRYTIIKLPNAGQIQAAVVRYLACLLAVLGMAMSYFIIDLLHVMTQPQYWEAAKLMPLLVSAGIATVLVGPLQTGILYSKRTQELFYINLATALVGAVLQAGLTHLLGLQGTCLALLVSSMMAVMLTARAAQRHFPVRYEARPLLVLVALWVTFLLLPIAFDRWDGAAMLGFKLLLLLGFVALLVLLKVVSPKEISRLFGRPLATRPS